MRAATNTPPSISAFSVCAPSRHCGAARLMSYRRVRSQCNPFVASVLKMGEHTQVFWGALVDLASAQIQSCDRELKRCDRDGLDDGEWCVKCVKPHCVRSRKSDALNHLSVVRRSELQDCMVLLDAICLRVPSEDNLALVSELLSGIANTVVSCGESEC